MSVAVIADLLKFLSVGGPNIINWNSFVHPAWVVTAIVLLVISTYLYSLRIWFFGIYFIVFAVALLNQYLHFSEILTYNCMLFNLVFVSLYLMSYDQ